MTSRILLVLTLVLFALPASPQESRVVSYDDDGMTTINGKRTLVIGSYTPVRTETKTSHLALYREMAEAGWNVIGGSARDLDDAQEAGLMMMLNGGLINPKDVKGSSRKLAERIARTKNHPALFMYSAVDEPAWTWMKAEQRVKADLTIQSYEVMKKADPNHLVYMNHSPVNLVSTMREYNAACDIIAMDIYPVIPHGIRVQYALNDDGLQGDLNNPYLSQVGEYVDKMREVAGPNRPLLIVLQGFSWEMLRGGNDRKLNLRIYPTYGQSRFMAWQTLIRGANGIMYWGLSYSPKQVPFWTNLKQVVREVADLSGPLSERTSPIRVEPVYHELGHSVDDGIQLLVKEYEDKLYVFTCNADHWEVKATLTGLGEWNACTVLNEGRAPEMCEEGITDTWAPFDVHLYVFQK